ncbi:FBXW8 protein, partial [Polypterus senegalus]
MQRRHSSNTDSLPPERTRTQTVGSEASLDEGGVFEGLKQEGPSHQQLFSGMVGLPSGNMTTTSFQAASLVLGSTSDVFIQMTTSTRDEGPHRPDNVPYLPRQLPHHHHHHFHQPPPHRSSLLHAATSDRHGNGDEGPEDPSTPAPALSELRAIISWLQKGLPFILILLAKVCFQHKLGKEVSFGHILDYNFPDSLIFVNPNIDSLDFFNLIWVVGITDFVLKFFTIGIKCIILVLPRIFLAFKSRGKFYLVIEELSQLFRSLVPIQLWYKYIMGDYSANSYLLSGVLIILYSLCKSFDVCGRIGALRKALKVLCSSQTFGVRASSQQCMEAGGVCAICHLDFSDPVILLCQNEINEIPFFDMDLPYELALKIFQHLNTTELGRCAQNRVGAISQLQYELGKVLCDVNSCAGHVIAGYTSGDVRLWDTQNLDIGSPYLRPSHVSRESALRPHVSHVCVNENVAVAAYEDGIIDVWSIEAGREPIHHYQHLQRVQALALGAEGTTVASASGKQVRVEQPDEQGYWQTTAQFELEKLVDFAQIIPGVRPRTLAVVAASDTVYLLEPGKDPSILHCVYSHPITCLDTSSSQAAVGVKSFGWAMNMGNKIDVYSWETGQAVVSLGSSSGDFTCVNLKDSPPNLLVSGNKDRRVRVFDLRTAKSVTSLYGHHMGVSAVQADDWKIVSGGEEGLLCVWEMRMAAKLWEMHNRHPVRHIHFHTQTLVTANIPDEKTPRGACITDDDLTAHRRHRGTIYLYDFSVDMSNGDHILPICRSSYAESHGYNYNIGLAVPYDNILAVPVATRPHVS